MTNAMAYLYRYSPVGMVGASQETVQALQLAKAGKARTSRDVVQKSWMRNGCSRLLALLLWLLLLNTESRTKMFLGMR
jgi:hypothetical protein